MGSNMFFRRKNEGTWCSCRGRRSQDLPTFRHNPQIPEAIFLGMARLVSGEISKLRYVILTVSSSRDVIISRYGSQKTKKIDSNLNREINDRMNDIGYLINDISCIFLILKSLSDDFD